MKMKLMKVILATSLALACSGSGAWGQTAPSPANPRPNDAQPEAKSYRITYTLTEMDGSKRVGTQHFAMIVVSGRKTVLKQGSKIPLATGTTSNSSGVQVQVQYMDIGLNIAASLEVDGVRLYTQVEQSSVAEEKSGLGTQDPIVRQTTLEGTSILTLGKPLMLGSMDVPGSTRHLDVEVVMEPLNRADGC
jgi:hypothetical protein